MKKVFVILLASLLLVAIVVPTFAWFGSKLADVLPTGIDGSTAPAYFESGDGSIDAPYIISNARHLYNLAWLQYIGYFNLGPANNGRAQSYFKIKDGVETIDMSALTLPPIGTTQYPFLGSLDGNGCVITGLTTANAKTAFSKTPTGAKFNAVNQLLSTYAAGDTADESEVGAVMGFFGVVGDYNNGADLANISSHAGYTVDTESKLDTEDDTTHDANSKILHVQNIGVSNLGIYDYTLQDSSAATTVGFAAGYVNAAFQDVAVGDCILTATADTIALSGRTEQISDHTLVGHCTEPYRGMLGVSEVKIYDPDAVDSVHDQKGEGDIQGWGGSVDMKTLHAKLLAMCSDDASAVNDYVHRLVREHTLNNEVRYVDEQTSSYFRVTDVGFKNYLSVVFSSRSTDGQYIYIGGGAMVTAKTYTYGENVTAYLITDGVNYLNLNAAGTGVTNGTDPATATKWFFGNGASGGYLSAEFDGILVYLNANNAAFSVSNTASTQWSFSNGRLSHGTGTRTYYVRCVQGTWSLNTAIATHTEITDGTNYLAVSGTTLVNSTTADVSAYWTFENGYFSTYVDNTAYYLYVNGNGELALTANTALRDTWTYENNRLCNADGYHLYCDVSGDAPIWLVEGSTHKFVADGNQYLNISDGNLTGGTSAANATAWTLTDVTGGVRFSAVVGTTTYYLYRNGTALALTTNVNNATAWEREGNSFSNGGYTIAYDGGWVLLAPEEAYLISDGNGNYLNANADGSGITNGTDAATATRWIFSSPGTNPSGTISTYIGGTRYYLVYNSGLDLDTSSDDWENSDNRLYVSETSWFWSTEYYIRYNNGWTTNMSSGTVLDFTETSLAAQNDLTVAFNAVGNTVISQTANNVLRTVAVTTREIKVTVSEEKLEFNTNGMDNATYIPLQMNDDYTTKSGNTGYIVSGLHDELTTDDNEPDNASGDIRVSWYSSDSISNKNYFVTITPDLSGFERYSVDAPPAHLEKYADCVETYQNSISGNIYGLHFMNADISKDMLVNIPKAVINGISYDNYKVPADCIDFSLKDKGYINFFAGTYFPGNTAFFSFHQIFRDADQNIVEIKEISKIYRHKNYQTQAYHPYVYLYKDGSWSGGYDALPADYELAFDMVWLTDPKTVTATNNAAWAENRAYYFEVPANAGEYALGSVEGHTGAYLIYLDIAANAQTVTRTTTTEIMTETTKIYAYAKGVTVIENSTDALTSTDKVAALAIAPGFTGDLALDLVGTDLTYTTTSNKITVSAAGGMDIYDSGGTPQTPTALHTKVKTTIRITMEDYNTATNTTTLYVITYVIERVDGVAGTATVTATQNGADATDTVVLGTEGSVTSLNTTKKNDLIDWSTITTTGRDEITTYGYYLMDANSAVTNAVAYTPAGEGTAAGFEITVISPEAMTVTFTQVDDTVSVTAKGAADGTATAISVGSTLDVPATAAG